MKKIFTLFLVLICLINIPISLIGNETGIFKDPDPEPTDSIMIEQENFSVYNKDYVKGITKAQEIAKSSTLFFFSGFCLGVVGILLPYIMTYNPPPESLVNKSVSYVMGLKEQYNKSMQSANGKLALIGFISYYGAVLLIYLVAIIFSILL